MPDVLSILSTGIMIAYIAAIVVCFRKGRRGFGWFGVITFLLGLITWFPMYRHVREFDTANGFWAMFLIGSVPAIVVIVAALQPAPAGSRSGTPSRERHSH